MGLPARKVKRLAPIAAAPAAPSGHRRIS
jgi:hypothetical protein